MTFSKDDLFEILILREIEGRDSLCRAVESFLDRLPTEEEMQGLYKKIDMIHNGWCWMNRNIRRLGKP